MQIVDLSLKINRHMIGIPKLHHYAENPTRCVVLSAVSEKQLEGIRARGLETADEPEVGHAMLSRREILGHSGTHIDAPMHFLEEGWTIDEVPLENIVKKGRVIPLTDAEPN